MYPFLKFMQSQKAMAIASHDNGRVWIANVYFGVDDQGMIYFVSSKKAAHSQLIIKNPVVAFSVVWFDPRNHKNRKGIQGLGECLIAEDDASITVGVRLHNQNFPEFKERITVDWIKTNENESKVWILRPTQIKYWDDELYAEQEFSEFIIKSE